MSEEIQGLEIRYTEINDQGPLKEWLLEPGILKWFPMIDEIEIDHTINHWIGLSKYKCSLTAVLDGKQVGLATLYLQPYRKLAHQCEFGIIVDQNVRNKGVGTALMNRLIHLAKENFNIELLHLQVYYGNPAIRLYERLGFTEFGRQDGWIKEDGEFLGRIFMEKYI